jgi:hypothetical protein
VAAGRVAQEPIVEDIERRSVLDVARDEHVRHPTHHHIMASRSHIAMVVRRVPDAVNAARIYFRVFTEREEKASIAIA